MVQIHWATEADSDKARTMFSLVKRNDGLWKSQKQSNFCRHRWATTHTPDQAAKFFGIPLQDGQFIVSVYGMIPVAEGRRGERHIHFMFVCDEKGIAAEYRIHFTDINNDGKFYKPNPERTEIKWSRPAQKHDVVVSTPKCSNQQEPTTTYEPTHYRDKRGRRVFIEYYGGDHKGYRVRQRAVGKMVYVPCSVDDLVDEVPQLAV